MLRELLRKGTDWSGWREPMVLFWILCLVLGCWTFIEITDQVLEGDARVFDVWMIKALRKPGQPTEPIGPPWMKGVGRDLTALGGFTTLTFFILAVGGFLWLTKRYRMLLFLLVATSSGTLLSLGLKQLFARPRPDVVPHLTTVYTASFPSGHAMMSAVVYLTLGALLASVLSRRRLKAYVLFLALLLTFLVGVSRVYMGVHYPTDVLAGWSAGLVWALACWLIARHLQHRGRVEGD